MERNHSVARSTTRASGSTGADGDLGRGIRVALAALSAGAASLHFAVMGEHFREYWLFGLFFVVTAWLQLGWAAGVLRSSSRSLLLGGAAGNALVVTIWAVSRALGLPVGPHRGVPEAMSFIDVLSTVFELIIIGGVFALLRFRVGGRSAPPRLTQGIAASTVLVVVGLSSAGLVSASEGHGHPAPNHDEAHHSSDNASGGPKVHTLTLEDGGSLRAYLDPPAAGRSGVHSTFFDSNGDELPVRSVEVKATSPRGDSSELETTRFSPGHFVSDVLLTAGQWTFSVRARTTSGDVVKFQFRDEIMRS